MKTLNCLSIFALFILCGICSNTNAQSEDKNYIKTRQLRVPVQSIQQLNNLNDQKIQTSIVYSDGIGRPIQQTAVAQSPNHWDIVQPIVYDELGRSSKQYLPYTKGAQGNFDAAFETNQYIFYRTQASIAHSLHAYSETLFEASPLSRVLEQSQPGVDWQLGSGHTQKLKQRLNVNSEVRHWKVVNSVCIHQGTYPEATLLVQETTDEHGNTFLVYTDQSGRKLLEKSQLGTNEWAETYFIYNDFGRLTYVIPPNAVKQMHTTQNYQVASLSEEELFIYRYNKRGLPVAKKVPGADWTYLIYDDYNRPVLVQDGNLRLQGKWHFTKYDAFERVILSGIYTPPPTQQAMITNAQITGLIPTSNLTMYEKRTNNPIGYSSNAFPNSDITVLEIFYYDDYDFDGNGLPDFTYLDPPDKLKNQVEQISSDSQIKSNVAAGITISYWNLPTTFNRGKLTGSKARILGSNDWITSASFYSEYGRVLQTQTSNHLSGVDVADMSYGFDGLLIKSNLKHAAFGTTIEVFNQFDYDHAGRLIAGWEQHNNGALIQLSEKRYNELGQLIENNLGVNNGNNLQSIDFAYNIRGWLTHINNADLSNDNVVAVDSNAYSEEINEIEINQITIETETSKDEFGNDQLTIIVEDERTNTYLEESTNTEKEVTTSTESESNLRETESNESTLDELSALNKKLEIDLNNMTFNEGTSLSQAYDQIEILVIQELTLNGIVDPAAVEEVVQNVINHLQKSIGNVYFNNDNDDLFGMELNYNRTQSNGLLPNAQYNGNISQLLWQSKGDEVKRAYDFSYDASNRLTSAGYREYDKVAETWNVNIDRYSVPAISYDANGNILSLERKGYLSNNTFGTIDQLTYSYDQNRLKAVEDVVSSGGYADFKNNVTNTTEYNYDANGNLISDLNKGISVQYNVLNLPELITFQNGSTIAYTYTANGQKLSATFMNAQDNSSYSRQYVGSFVYNDTQLEFFGTAEGRAISDPSTGGFLVEYHYKDHLGNTRLTFSDRDNSGTIDVATEVLQQEHYYPYGMTFEGTNAAVIDGKHQFLYTGKENYDQFGLNWMDFGARFYDPALGRWHSVDPLADKYLSYSPYNSVLGNPLKFIDPDGKSPTPPKNVHYYNMIKDNKGHYKPVYSHSNSNLSVRTDATAVNTSTDIKGTLFEGNYGTQESTTNVYSYWNEDGTIKDQTVKSKTLELFSTSEYIQASNIIYGSESSTESSTQNISAVTILGIGIGVGDELTNSKLTGKWLGKNLKYYDYSWGGNGSTGGKIKWAGNVGKVAKFGGAATALWSYKTILSDYNSGAINGKQAAIETTSNTIGLIPLYGTVWTIGFEAGKVAGPSTWYGNNDFKWFE